MTATPRIFAAPELAESADITRPRRRGTAPNQELEVDAFANSMDNEQVYGKKVFDTPSPRQWKTAGLRTTASWRPPSPTPTCAAA
ncbi:hypothetical protein ABZ178_40405 [Streptomyces massasporeus]|uniref:hypothetical protein n=1 Tax=Streptomyces massasporeus TaxID=67324 RepID=UPI0033A772C9